MLSATIYCRINFGKRSVSQTISFDSDMFSPIIILGVSLACATVFADVSHLVPFNSYDSGDTDFDGYHYDTPALPFPPTTTTTTTQLPFTLPEIIVNKRRKPNKPSSAYLPPSIQPVGTEPPFLVPPLSDDSNIYLPPSPEIDAPPSTYLPAQPIDTVVVEQPSTIYLPPPSPPIFADEPSKPSVFDETFGYHYAPSPKHTTVNLRNHKNIDLFRNANQTNSNAVRVELNDLRCLQNRNGYFRANIIARSFIDTLPIVDVGAQSTQCQLRLVRTTFVLNIRANDFERCGVYVCSNNELCVKLRFPQITGMKSANDALLTLQCKLQERVATKIHSLRFGITDIRYQKN